MGVVEDGAPRRLIDPPILHAHQAVFHNVQQADAVLPAQLIQLADDVAGLHVLPVDGHRHALDKVQGHIGGLVRGGQGAHAHLQKALLLIQGLVGRVLQVQTLVGEVPEVLVLGIVGLPADFQGDVVGLGVVDLLVPALDIPLPPGGDDLHLRGEALDGQLKAHLVVALAGAAVADGVGPLLFGDLHQPLGDDGPGKGGAQKIVFVLGPHLHGGDDHLIHHLVGKVLDVELRSPGLDGLLLQAVQLGALAHVGGDRHHLTVVVVLLEPGDDDGCIQPAGIGEHDFFDAAVVDHGKNPPCPSMLETVYHLPGKNARGNSHKYANCLRNFSYILPISFINIRYIMNIIGLSAPLPPEWTASARIFPRRHFKDGTACGPHPGGRDGGGPR